jgi:hypothetical protein
MITTAKILTLAFFIGFACTAEAQTGKAKPATTKPKTTAKKSAPAPVKKDITIDLKSLCEANVAIYAGPKEGLKQHKVNTVGGLSKTKLYVKTYDVVCIISAAGKVQSCADIKPQTTVAEINVSGTVITAK